MRALITGITGFAGSHLADYLAEREDTEIFGTIRMNSRMSNIKHLLNRINLINCDLLDSQSVDAMIKEIKPDLIFHLAAQSFVPISWEAPSETIVNNVVSQINILESVRKHDVDCKIQIACSSEEYGMVRHDELPLKETNPLRPLNPYAVSKVTQDLLGYQYYQSYGLQVIRTRAFNHTGPRSGGEFATSNFAKQIAQIELGLNPPQILVGNLSAERDFTDVRDVVKAYWMSLDKGVPGEVYNIASNKVYSIEDLLLTLLSFSNTKIEIDVDFERIRKSDVEVLLGDYLKLHNQTGWVPTIPIEKTMEDLLIYWREVLRG